MFNIFYILWNLMLKTHTRYKYLYEKQISSVTT